MRTENRYVYVEALDTKHAYRVDFQDLKSSFKRNFKINNTYEISFTLTYTEQYKEVFNTAKDKLGVYYDGNFYDIEEREPSLDENGLTTLKLTCAHSIVDRLKNLRVDKQYPTEDNPEISGGNSSSSDQDNSQSQKGTVITVKKVSEKQTKSLDDCLKSFFNNNDQSISYELHGNFPNQSIDDVSGSCWEWLTSNLSKFGGYMIFDAYTVKIYDFDSLKKSTGKVFRYLSDMTNVTITDNSRDIVNDCEVYGGKMEKDITNTITTGGGIPANATSEPVNGDWSPVFKYAASLVGESLSDADIANLNNRVRIESGGDENIANNWDSNAMAGHPSKGLFQFIESTFNTYARPPFTTWVGKGSGLCQTIAVMNIPNWRQQIAGSGGWSPHGAPISKAEIKVTSGADEIADFCKSFVGKVPYVWGGNDTSGWDCSGFVNYVWKHFGIPLPSSRPVTTTLETMGSVVNPPYQTGDLLFWGSRGSSYHVSIAIDSEWRVGADNPSDGTVLRKISSWQPDFAVRVPKFAELAGGNAVTASPDSGNTTTSTTKETYYSLHYHFTDQDSINKYKIHRGKVIVADSIYDMNELKAYVEKTVQSEPAITLDIGEVHADGVNQGDTWRLIAPELNIDEDVTVMDISGPDEGLTGPSEEGITLTFNNTGAAVNDANIALLKDIHSTNSNLANIAGYGVNGTRQENHFDNESTKKDTSNDKEYEKHENKPMFSNSDLQAMRDFANS